MGDTNNRDTQPIEIPPKPSRLIRILDEAEMTDREIRYASVVATGTLRGQLEAHRILYPDAYMEEPTPYSHNLSVWQKRLLHIGLVAATIPVLGIVVALIVFTHYNSVAVTSGVVVTLIMIGGYILLYHLIEWQWRETRVTCTAGALAYKRSAHPFLDIDELDLRTPISGLSLKHKGRPWLARVLWINCWTLRFESAAQEDEFLRTRFKFIVDGDILVETIADFVRFNSRKIG